MASSFLKKDLKPKMENKADYNLKGNGKQAGANGAQAGGADDTQAVGADGAQAGGADGKPSAPTGVLARQVKWEDMYFYQKSDVIYQLAFAFCDRFIDRYKDRTRDQVIQAARSCKQNIVEGLADGVTSTEMQLKLINVARASLKELREDFSDYLKSRHLELYAAGESRYEAMLAYCRRHNRLADYEPFFAKWSDEQMCNCGLTLCHMTDKMLMSFLQKLEREFISEGGIKERMYRARTGYRQKQDELFREQGERLRQQEAKLRQQEAGMKQQEARLAALEQQLAAANAEAQRWQAAYNDLKQRALAAYYKQKEEIEELKKRLGEG